MASRNKVEKPGQGHFKFTLPNKKIITLREFNSRTGVARYVELIDPDPPHKPRYLSPQYAPPGKAQRQTDNGTPLSPH